jgi:hypothetical protein
MSGEDCRVAALRRVDDVEVDVESVLTVLGPGDPPDWFAVTVREGLADYVVDVKCSGGE